MSPSGSPSSSVRLPFAVVVLSTALAAPVLASDDPGSSLLRHTLAHPADLAADAAFTGAAISGEVTGAVTFASARGQAADEPATTGGNRRVKGMLLSALLPGLGQYWDGQRNWAYGFFAAEAAVWGTYAGFKIQQGVREDRYIDFAERFGGVADAEGQSDTYYVDLGKYESFGEYEVIATRAEEGEIYGADQRWSWPTTERRRRYRDLHSQAEDSEQNAELMFAVALLNRALSVVHAARSISNEPRMAIQVRPGHEGELVPTLTWATRF